MKHYMLVFLLVIAAFGSLGGAAAAEGYLLQPRDVLDIGVWGFEELQGKEAKEIIVRPDGKIAFPLVGEVQAAGLTSAELSQALTQGLSEYIINPQVTVNISKYHTTRVYVLGQVTKPGMYEVDKQHNLLDAIGMAGGYTNYAAKKKVFVIKKDNVDKPLKADLLKLLTKGDMSQNYALADGDVVYLSGNGKIDFARDIAPWISAAYTLERIGE